jgi:hypothetical protein
MARLTKKVRQQLLDQNEGFTRRTYYEGRNSREERIYTISGGHLHIRAIGKTSWADSRYDDEWVASDEEAHRFLYGHQYEMNTDGIG